MTSGSAKIVRIGLLHPGAMGQSVGAALKAAGHTCLWASEGRSESSRARAEKAGLEDVLTLQTMAQQAEVIVSVCPPEFAETVACNVVQACGFRGIFVDANAIAPATAARISSVVEVPGATFVDGGIIGPPAWREGTTRFYLSGARAAEVAALFVGTLLDARVVEGGGSASALKVAYAGWMKGSGALLLAANAFAMASGVHNELMAEWALSQPQLLEQTRRTAAGVGPKAWRFCGEMEEIAGAYAAQGLPPGFHAGATDIFARLAHLKNTEDAEALRPDAVVGAIAKGVPSKEDD